MDTLLSSNLEEEDLDEEVINCIKQMTHPREAFYKAKEMKDEGNKLFRKRDFGQAIITYEKAYQFLSVGEPLHDQDVSMMMDLATSLSLNLAACGLKVGDFDKTITFSSIALDFDPKNVKALFRRAVAFIKMNRMDDALKDLERAIEFDPSNQEVLKEFTKVEKALGISTNQLMKDEQNLPVNMEGRDQNSAGEVAIKNDCSFNEKSSSQGDEDPREAQGEDYSNQAHSPNLNSMSCVEGGTTSSPAESPASPMDEDGVETTSSQLAFRPKKKRSGCSMLLSKTSYDLLIKGKRLDFYDPTSMSHMTVRIRTTELSTSETPIPKEVELDKEEQKTQGETQVQRPSQEPKEISMETQGYEVDDKLQRHNYCPKKFKRLKLSTNRFSLNLSDTNKKQTHSKQGRNRYRSYNKRKIINKKRKQEKVTLDDAQIHPKRRLGILIDYCSVLDVGCKFDFDSLCKNSIVGHVDMGDAKAF